MKRNFLIKLALLFFLVVSAIKVDAQTKYKAISLKKDSLGSFSSRISVSTNFIDWATFTPNIGFDYDVGNQNMIGGQSVFLNFKYITDDKYSLVKNNKWSGRLEYRWHYKYLPLVQPEKMKGRSYVGVFGEYWDNDGMAGGISGGYQFPAFYNKHHYWQFHAGANIGVMAKKSVPVVGELRFGLTYSKESISRKFWKADTKSNSINIAQNREMQILIDSITDNYSTDTKIFIRVPKVNDDYSLKNPIGKKEVINAIRKQTGMNLASANFVNDTIFPIRKIDNYTITYRFHKAVNKKTEEDESTDVTFRFRVELEGREEAEKLKESFVEAVQKYRNEKGIPVLYAKAKERTDNRNEIDGYIPMQEVMTLFSRIWGKTISLQQFKGVSERIGVGVLRPVDEKGITRKTRYTISLSFHPEVQLNYDTDPVISQFEVQFRGEAGGLALYNNINGRRMTFQREWNGTDIFSPEVTAEEIAKTLVESGIRVTADMISLSKGLNRFNERYTAAVYLPAAYVANVSFVVQDVGGLEKSKADMNNVINPWVKTKEWPEIIRREDTQDPIELDIPEEQVIEVFRKVSGYRFMHYQFLDFCVDSKYELMPDGRYRAYARIQLHPENSSILKIPYYVKFAR